MEFFPQHIAKAVKKKAAHHHGFTFVEILVVFAMLAVLAIAIMFIVNPLAQITKAQNAARQHDFEEIKTALDGYYDDTGCYPTTLSFDVTFSLNNKIYMQHVPQDPACQANGTNCYIYQIDATSSCPQWNVLYAKLATPIVQRAVCELSSIDATCVPKNYATLGTNYCVLSGKVDCAYISSGGLTPVPPPGGGQQPTATPTPGGGGGGGAPTPTQGLCQQNYACTGIGANGCNVIAQTPSPCRSNGGIINCYCVSNCAGQCH